MQTTMTRPRRNRGATAAATKAIELSAAAAQVIAHRTTRMALAGFVLSPRDSKEFTGMVIEKQVAFAQAWMALLAEGLRIQQQFMLSLMAGATPQQHAARARRAAARLANDGLAPLHRKAMSNAKRLARTKLR